MQKITAPVWMGDDDLATEITRIIVEDAFLEESGYFQRIFRQIRRVPRMTRVMLVEALRKREVAP